MSGNKPNITILKFHLYDFMSEMVKSNLQTFEIFCQDQLISSFKQSSSLVWLILLQDELDFKLELLEINLSANSDNRIQNLLLYIKPF